MFRIAIPHFTITFTIIRRNCETFILGSSNFQLRIRALSRIFEPKCNDDDVTFHIYVQIAHYVLHAIYICLTLRDVELDLEGI